MNIIRTKKQRTAKPKYPIKMTYLVKNMGDGENHQYEYTTQISVSIDSSIRENAIKVIKESLGKIPNWFNEIDDDQTIIIYLEGRTKEEAQNAPFGILYDLLDNGSVKFLNETEPTRYDWTYGKIIKLKDAGFISGNINHIIIETPDGLGSLGEAELHTIVEGILKFIGIIASVEGTLQFLDRILSKIKCRKTTKRFQKSGLRSLKQIRLLLETKEKWKLKNVMKVFAINRKMAIAILKKLGYAPINGEWTFDKTSMKSLNAREEWLKQEEKEQIRMEELLLKK